MATSSVLPTWDDRFDPDPIVGLDIAQVAHGLLLKPRLRSSMGETADLKAQDRVPAVLGHGGEDQTDEALVPLIGVRILSGFGLFPGLLERRIGDDPLTGEVAAARRCGQAARCALHFGQTGGGRAIAFQKSSGELAAVSPTSVSGRVHASPDMRGLADSSLDFRLTTGRFNDAFEAVLARRLGAEVVLTVNSDSSSNLVASSGLTSSRLEGRRLQPGEEVITAAMGFPTTVNPTLVIGHGRNLWGVA